VNNPEINKWVKYLVFAILWLTISFCIVTIYLGADVGELVDETLGIALVCVVVLIIGGCEITSRFFPKRKKG